MLMHVILVYDVTKSKQFNDLKEYWDLHIKDNISKETIKKNINI